MTVVRAPRGYGKSTLVSQWLASRHGDGSAKAWLTLEDDDGESTQFWPKVRQDLAFAGVEPAEAPGDARTQVRHSLQAAPGPVTLVLDNYEQVRNLAIDEQLVDLIRGCPNLRVVCCQRGRRQFESKITAGLEISTIDPVDLLFTADETADTLRAMGVELDPTRAEYAHSETRGWPLAVRACAVAFGNLTESVSDATVMRRAAETFVLEEIVGEPVVSAAYQQVCELAIPAHLTGEVAAELGNDGEHGRLLKGLELHGIVHSELEDGTLVYRWPPLARQVLCEAMEDVDAARAREVHRRLAHLYSHPGSWHHAIEHALRASESTVALEAVEAGWAQLAVSHPEALELAFTEIPDDALDQYPLAVIVRSIAQPTREANVRTTFKLPASKARLESLGRSNRAREALAMGTALMLALRRRGDAQEALSLAQRMEVVARAACDGPSPATQEMLPLVFLQAGITLQALGETDDAIMPLTEAYKTAGSGPYRGIAYEAAGALALSETLLEHATAAQTWLDRQAESPAPAPRGPLAESMTVSRRVAQLLLAIDQLDRSAADTGIADLAETNMADEDLWAFVLFARTRYALVWGGRTEVLKQISRARAVRRATPWRRALEVFLRTAEVNLLTALGRPNAAQKVLDAAERATRLLYPSRARLALLTGSPREALDIAETGIRNESTAVSGHIELRLLQAVCHHHLGNSEAGADILERTVQMVGPAPIRRPFTSVPRRWLAELAELAPSAQSVLKEMGRREVLDVFPESLDPVVLSDREQVVLIKLSEGLTLEQISRELVVSTNTVKSQVRSIYRKLDVSTRQDALHAAVRADLIADDPLDDS
ncbi:MAG: LuxR C-terminal-related transcriptional regulator [Nocardioidaceae bacterium]